MTPTVAVRVLAVAVLAVAASAQEPDGKYTLGGTVTNSQTGEPVKRALVSLVHYNAPRMPAPGGDGRFALPPRPLTLTTFTDSAGVFWFNGLEPGNYSVSAQKPGFRIFFPQGRTEPSGQVNLTASRTDVRLMLAPYGVITGRLVDRDGAPLRGRAVIALSVTIQDGVRQTNVSRTDSTDDRGIYRLWNLAPGKYYIKAAGRSGGTFVYAGDTAPRYGTEESFAPSYFGGGGALESAAPVPIEAGTEARADFALQMEPAYRIRGTLANFVPHRTVRFELLSGDEDVSASRVSVNGDTGVFEIHDVVPGAYRLHATQQKTSADVPVTVGGSDVSGIVVTLASGVDLKVLTHYADGGEQGGCTASLRPASQRNGGVIDADRADDADDDIDSVGEPQRKSSNESTLAGVLPGAYRFVINCFGAYARSSMWGSQDLLANPVLTVQPGAQPPPLEILAAHGGGTVAGTVSADAKLVNAGILLVPQFVESTGPIVAMAFRGRGQEGELRFQFRSLAPGAYMAYAFPDIKDLEYRNPEVLRTLSGGVSVQVEDGSEKEIAIAVVSP